MDTFIVERHHIDWGQIADRYRQTGIYDKKDFLPDPLPRFFPTEITDYIDIWNATFAVDFFSCRHKLNQIARKTWEAVDTAKIVKITDLPEISQHLQSSLGVCCLVDDDDWFAPDLAAALEEAHTGKAHVVRWPSPVFAGDFEVRKVPKHLPRLSLKLYKFAEKHPRIYPLLPTRLLGKGQFPGSRVTHPDVLLQTNNYCLTSRFFRESSQDIPHVIDHVNASYYILRSSYSLDTIENLALSATNKHPCSVTVLARATKSKNPQKQLREWVSQYVETAQNSNVPPFMSWAQTAVDETITLFLQALTEV